jgi:hypothetical protein
LNGSGAVRSSDPVQLQEAGREGDAELAVEVDVTGALIGGLASITTSLTFSAAASFSAAPSRSR